ncbi:hypothetical protein BH24DEI2_BH24DEI2_03230 [soil metagenome]
MSFTFQGLGGTSEVGASCYLYTFGDTAQQTRVLIDAGTRPNTLGAASLPEFDLLGNAPDALLLTHAHSDHIGALPLLKQRFPNLPVYATPATAHIALAMLTDAVKVQASQGAPLYELKNVAAALAGIRPVSPGAPFRLGSLGDVVTAYNAGHLLGAVSYLLETPHGRVFHTGDVSNVGGYTTDAALIPDHPPKCDVVVCESTYGDTVSHVSRKSEVRRFAVAVGETLEAGGRVLVPAFALGRSTEVALTLADHMQGGLIPKVPIVLDGLVRTLHQAMAESLFDQLPVTLQNRAHNSGGNPLYPDTLLSVESNRQRQGLIHSREPMVVIASSGMLSAGVSPLYAKPLVQDERNLLAFVGYQDEGAPGKRLLESTESGGEVKLPTGPSNSFETVPVHCKLGAFSFSGHADAGGLVALVKRYSPKRVVLVHGDGGSRQALGGLLKKSAQVEWPQNGDIIDLAAPTYLETLQQRRDQTSTTESPTASTDSPTSDKRRTKLVRFKTTVTAKLEGQRLVLEFPEEVDTRHLLGGVDSFRVEIAKGERLKVKLREVWGREGDGEEGSE